MRTCQMRTAITRVMSNERRVMGRLRRYFQADIQALTWRDLSVLKVRFQFFFPLRPRRPPR